MINKGVKQTFQIIEESRTKDGDSREEYFDIIRKAYNLSPFWISAIQAMLASPNPKIKDAFVSTFMVQQVFNEHIQDNVIKVIVSNEASKQGMERMYSKIYNLYKEKNLKNSSKNPKVEIQPIFDDITGNTYYALIIYPGAGKRLVLKQYSWIMNKYKEAGIYERWQERKGTIKQLEAILSVEVFGNSSNLMPVIYSDLDDEEWYNKRMLEIRGKKKLDRLRGKSGPRNDL